MSEKVNYKEFPSSAKELRNHYSVSLPTWIKWLKPIAAKIRKHAKVYKPDELKVIIDFLEGQ